jgi:hypothetical protein
VKFLDEQHQAADIYLHQLDFKFVKDFEVFLRNHKPTDHQKPLANNGVMKHIIRLKKMVNLAMNLQWIDNTTPALILVLPVWFPSEAAHWGLAGGLLPALSDLEAA